MRILLIEDNEPEAYLIASLLRPLSIKIAIAHSMAEADQQMVGQLFDVIVMDLNLPDSTPKMTEGRIQELKKMGCKIVIIITGVPIDNDPVRAKELGADAFFYKGDPDFAGKIQAQLGTRK